MHISIVSLFPELYSSFIETSLVKRACEKGIVDISTKSFFSYVAPKERIDAPSFGHGSGMLIKPAVVEAAVRDHEAQFGKAHKIFFSPQGRKLNQHVVKELADLFQQQKHIMLLPARYEGMDARVEQEYADSILSIGDYVLMGGDLPAMVLLESLLRFIPGVVGKMASVEHDSFSGPFVDYPEYTEPVEWHGREVPAVIRSGHHQQVDMWRFDQSVQKTVFHHFDWLRSHALNEREVAQSNAYIPPHYVALMHTDVLVGSEKIPGCTSVTSLDIHDIARSARTYNIKGYFIVTPLYDQQQIVKTLLNFWQEGAGIEYNQKRHEAVSKASLRGSFDEVVEAIEQKEGQAPIVIATSARPVEGIQSITFYDQELVWSKKRPVLFLFGTGQGLSNERVQSCDYILPPIMGFSKFNHLSVRSAAAIVFDRWLGINQKWHR